MKSTLRVTKNFDLKEFVPKELFHVYGTNCTRFMRVGIFNTAQALRDTFGTTIINNWSYGGVRQWSGYRDSKYKGYSPLSAHSFGDAIDCIFTKVTAEEARKYILENRDKFSYITRFEKGVSWLHVDGLFTGKKDIVQFAKPKKVRA